jgi:hypothetical protein
VELVQKLLSLSFTSTVIEDLCFCAVVDFQFDLFVLGLFWGLEVFHVELADFGEQTVSTFLELFR